MSTSLRWIISDDTSSDIQYVQGDWFQDSSGSQDASGNYGPVFQGTLHGVRTGPASLVYKFTGSQVQVFGSNNIQNNSGILNPSWDCFVDGVSIGSMPYQFPENNWQFCRSPVLPDGNHVLTVNASVASPQTFWIDKIQYLPVAGSQSQLTNATVLVDNLDPMLKPAFGKGWVELGGGANMTTLSGSQFTLNFTGISLSWYGFIPKELPIASTTGSYSIDGGSPSSFLLKGLPTNAITVYNQKFFQTSTLSPGNHQIIVTYNGGGQTTPLTLDYLVIQNASVPATTPPPAGGQSNGGKSNIAAIAGGVVGGVVIIALAALGLLFIRRRYRSSAGRSDVKGGNVEGAGNSTTPRPYNYTPMPAHMRSDSGVDMYTSSSGRPEQTTTSMSEVRRKAHHTANPSVSTTNGTSTGLLGSSVANTAGHQPRPSQSQSDFLTSGGSSTGRGESLVNDESNTSSLGARGDPSSRNDKLRREAAAVAAQTQGRNQPRGPTSPPLTAESEQSMYIRHEDSGIRMPGVVEVPPEYTPS
ncbi:hypothetical protein D9619_005257 [Psilocybe cf. subviscida]|uniref:Uncharacterized protein n=1 Tax=Psilocybe cf. subviscida TaxID=2480587 RepID=A0A8H5BX22_9AGAR|nr:hypothetical protein D9619_005257 [Psilocybe cf. subviscida]